jgi:uncharacterized protein
MEHAQLAWYIGGPVLGLCVVAMRWLLNERLGATGAWSDVIERVSGRGGAFGTRGWFLVGLVVGGLVVALVAGTPTFEGYGWLTDTFDDPVVVAILVGAGLLIGFGAKLATGCTSGNGLSGNAMTSPAALAATATFFGVAIAVSFITEALF